MIIQSRCLINPSGADNISKELGPGSLHYMDNAE